MTDVPWWAELPLPTGRTIPQEAFDHAGKYRADDFGDRYKALLALRDLHTVNLYRKGTKGPVGAFKLTAPQKLILWNVLSRARLRLHWDNPEGDHAWIAWPSRKRLARECCCSESTITTAVKELCRVGLLERVVGSGIPGSSAGLGASRPSVYRIDPDMIIQCEQGYGRWEPERVEVYEEGP